MRFGKFDRLVDHSDCTIGCRCKHHFGAENRVSLRRSTLKVSAIVTTRG